MTTIVYILVAILIFGILIAVHELGHFLAAKACGVTVNEFSIGMGPALWKKQKGETLYALRAIPCGGFCAMEGEDEDSDDPHALYRQGFWAKLVIFAAGAFMNFVTGLLILVILYSGAKAFYDPTITAFADGCPLQGESGLQVGDKLLSIFIVTVPPGQPRAPDGLLPVYVLRRRTAAGAEQGRHLRSGGAA